MGIKCSSVYELCANFVKAYRAQSYIAIVHCTICTVHIYTVSCVTVHTQVCQTSRMYYIPLKYCNNHIHNRTQHYKSLVT